MSKANRCGARLEIKVMKHCISVPGQFQAQECHKKEKGLQMHWPLTSVNISINAEALLVRSFQVCAKEERHTAVISFYCPSIWESGKHSVSSGVDVPASSPQGQTVQCSEMSKNQISYIMCCYSAEVVFTSFKFLVSYLNVLILSCVRLYSLSWFCKPVLESRILWHFSVDTIMFCFFLRLEN